MLKPVLSTVDNHCYGQPPSGGCVLKNSVYVVDAYGDCAATFGWLCVETPVPNTYFALIEPQPPSGGCVLKLSVEGLLRADSAGSHLRVAVC